MRASADARSRGDSMSRRKTRASVEGFAFLLALALFAAALGFALHLAGPYYE